MDTKRPDTLPCDKCNKDFLVPRRGPMVYICKECRGQVSKKRPYKLNCWQCHEEFVVPRTGRMVYRCKSCQTWVMRNLRKNRSS